MANTWPGECRPQIAHEYIRNSASQDPIGQFVMEAQSAECRRCEASGIRSTPCRDSPTPVTIGVLISLTANVVRFTCTLHISFACWQAEVSTCGAGNIEHGRHRTPAVLHSPRHRKRSSSSTWPNRSSYLLKQGFDNGVRPL